MQTMRRLTVGSAPRHDIQQRQRHRNTSAAEESSTIELHDKLLFDHKWGVHLTMHLTH
jgi:hypothetical protein